MRSRYYARKKERAHFVTSTIVDWLPVFAVPGFLHALFCVDGQ
jgi:hypothetical protein